MVIWTHTRFLSQIALTALKYETPMFQEFRTQNWLLNNGFIWVYEYSLILKINFFPKALLAASVSCHMQRFNFKNSINICQYSIFLTAYTHFQNFTSFFSNLYTQIQELHTQNASQLLQNEALHSKYPKHISKANICKHICRQCWGKLLLKVMHYNIVLLPKKVTKYVTFALLFKY